MVMIKASGVVSRTLEMGKKDLVVQMASLLCEKKIYIYRS